MFLTVDLNSTNKLWGNNNGTLPLQAINQEPVQNATRYIGASWGDYDNDGYMDLFITTIGASIPNELYRNVNGVLTKVTTGNIVTDLADSRGSCWGDYNNDGWLDLYVANTGAENFLYLNNGDGTFTKVSNNLTTTPSVSSSCSWRDIDGDGDLDLFVTDMNPSNKNMLFMNNGTGNNWVNVKLTGLNEEYVPTPGTASNRAAIGARIKLTATIDGNTFTQMREVSGQTAYATQSGLFAHFGLGDATTIDKIQIEWPSGIVQVYENEEINKLLEYTEIAPPVTPSPLIATAISHNTIDLSWTAAVPVDGSFILERSVNDQTNFVQIAEVDENETTYEDNGLSSATTYYYRIKAKNPSGESTYSPVANATTADIPVLAPSNLVANAVSPLEIQLTWVDESDNETGFVIERNTAGQPTFLINIGPNITSYNDNDNIEENTLYTYTIKAVLDGESSANSNQANVTTPHFILPPNNLAASVISYDEVHLTWADNSDNETGFVIERSLTSSMGFTEIHTAGAGVVEYYDQTVDPGTTYYYRIKAVNATHSSAYSLEVNVTTDPFTIVGPSNLEVSAVSPVEIEITWTDESDNESGFVLERNTAGQPTHIINIGANTTTHIDNDNLEENTLYTYTIKAVMGVESSAYSNEASVTTPPFILPPNNLTASVISYDELHLTWTDNSDNETGFVIERSLTSSMGFTEIHTAGAGVVEYYDQTVDPGTTYYYRIKAVNATHSSIYTTEINVTTDPFIIAAPANLVANAISAQEIQLSWDDNSNNETGFVLERSTTGQPIVSINIPANTTTFTDTDNLDEETIYAYKIKAINGGESSSYSNEVSVTTPPFIVSPSSLLAIAISHNQITLTWADHSNNETGFVIERSLTSGAGFVEIHTTSANIITYTDLLLEPSTTYYYRVKAINATHSSKYSSESNVMTMEYSPLTITLPTIYEQTGTNISIPLTVRNFKDVLAFQFGITWDPAVLSYQSTDQLALSAIGVNPVAAGLNVLWEDGGVAESLPDHTVLMHVNFQIIGANGTSSLVNIPAEPAGLLKLEFIDDNSSTIDVQINPGMVYSQAMVTLAGTIKNAKGEPVKEARLDLTDITGDEDQSVISENGSYSFSIKPGKQAEIEVFKNNDILVNNGITTLDIALIRRHLLFPTMRLNDPYKIIAADVTNDGSVSIADAAAIRKVVLAMENTFSSGLWKFVPASHIFVNPDDPFGFPEKIDIPVTLDNNTLDFIGVKMGDVNYSWDHTKARKSANEPLQIIMPEIEWEGQEIITIPVSIGNFKDLSAFQFTISWDPDKLGFMETSENAVKVHFGQHKVSEGYLTIAWDDPSGKSITLEDGAVIFELQFKVQKAASTDIQINSILTLGIAYDKDLSEVEILPTHAKMIMPGAEKSTPEFSTRLFQNYPNPFDRAEGTTLHFELEEAGFARIVIANAVGKIIDVIEGEFSAGIHKLQWSNSRVPTGIYIIQLESGNIKISKKMSIINK